MEESLTLNPLFGEGCVLQSGMPVRIWGMGRPGATVVVSMQGRRAETAVDGDGAWTVSLGPLEVGGPYPLTVAYAVADPEPAHRDVSQSGESDNANVAMASVSYESADRDISAEPAAQAVVRSWVYVGEVFVCAGQSNMEYQMEFLHWRYPSEFTREPDPLLRHCKVPVRYDFHGPRRDFDEPVRWVGAAPDTLDEFTGVGYFFGRMVRERLGVPVGLLNITLGGSPIESWMDEETLADWPLALSELEPYRDDAEAARRIDDSLAAIRRWHDDLRLPRTDAAALADWDPASDAEPRMAWRRIMLPSFLDDAPDPALHGLRGSVYLHRSVTLPRFHAGAPAALHLGAMVDSDVTYVNGVEVGRSEHQYLSRDYAVPSGVLRAGRNDIVVRLVAEKGTGRVTPGKRMHLDVGDDVYDLAGAWSYAIGATAPADCPGEDFVRWKPLGLYNGMTAPCAGYAARAVLWYQGESNTGDTADEYGRMLAAMIGCWRRAWGQRRLPFLIVQLPGFSIDGVEDGGWPLVRARQWQTARDVDDVAVVVTLDAGDWNDLHPWNKALVAERLFDAARGLVYGEDDAPRPPEPTGARLEDGALVIGFDDGTGACGLATVDGDEPGEFELVWEDGSKAAVPARLRGDAVIIDVPWRRPSYVRYAWRNAPGRGLLCGANGVPAPPFVMAIE